MLITSERLDLHPLPLLLIEALLAGDLERARGSAPYAIGVETFAGDDYVLGLRRDQLRADPAGLPWLFRAGVLRATGEVVARAGFHAPPDAAGLVEIGYRVQPAWQGRGLATETARALLSWAGRQGARTCLASVRPDNAASLAVVARLGFVRVGEQIDEIDGLEWVFSVDLPARPGMI